MRFRAFRQGVARSAHSVRGLAATGASLLALAGCAAILGFDDTTLRSTDGAVDGSSDQDASAANDGALPALTTTPASLVVRRGASTDLTLDLDRTFDLAGRVKVSVTNLPAGISATTATLVPPAKTGKLALTATAQATLGPSTIDLVAEGALPSPASIPLLVADPAGTLDTTFDTDGLVTDSSRGLGATFFALASQGDGKIIAGGAAGPVGGPLAGWIARRYATSGAPDTGFNSATAGLPADGELRAMAIDFAGRIVCVGSSTESAPPLLLTVVRLLPTGAVDAAFGGGAVRLPATETPMGSIGLGVALQADGSVVVVGAGRDVSNVEAGVIARFKANGVRDNAFNAGATIVVPNARLVGVALDADGSVLVAGSVTSGPTPSYMLTKFTAQGAGDPVFSTRTFGTTYRANAFARLANGTSVVVGDVQVGQAAYTVGAAANIGVPLFEHAFAFAPGAGLFGVAAQDPKVFIAAGHTAVVNGEARVMRIAADGTNDTSFGIAGASIIEPAGAVNGFDVTLFSVAVPADGRILVAGNRSNAGAVVYRLWQ